MLIRAATPKDCRPIAELAMIAGEGIPAFFWAQSRIGDEDLIDVGARNAASMDENFSYRNAHLAMVDRSIAGMLLAYRLPGAEEAESLEDYPAFIRPLIELEQCAPDSFYINMIATYPQYRNRGIGTRLLDAVDRLARQAGCSTISVEVFEQNEGALRLYQRLGYAIVQQRDVIAHPCHHYSGRIFLLTRAAAAA